MTPFGIHWFRRDLRIKSNPGLLWNLKKTQGHMLGIFFFDHQFLSRTDFSAQRFAFFLNTLLILQEELQDLGSDLLVLDQGPEIGFDWILEILKPHTPAWITWNRDYEPFAIQRDLRITQFLQQKDIPLHTERDHLIFEPHEIFKNDEEHSFYQVYSHFAKKWLSLLQKNEHRIKTESQRDNVQNHLKWSNLLKSHHLPHKRIEHYLQKNAKNVTIPIPQAGTSTAYGLIKQFQSTIDQYEDLRNHPSNPQGASHLSIYLKNGSITTSMVINSLKLNEIDFNIPSGKLQFLKEIIWREFYYHILYHRPDVEKQAFLEKFRYISWENRKDWFEQWTMGCTGYPIVDAGMRQLNTTGTLPNRIRMIVASFLTKDLLIDWRWGENYFMKHLLDGDLAANNGGWQWAASTGCDPQPYFRIFNPSLQSLKFDPKGDYRRQFLPQLHNPPIVDHALQKIKALELYKESRNQFLRMKTNSLM